MKIIFNAQSISYPLTGIGHFSYEILQELNRVAEIHPFSFNLSLSKNEKISTKNQIKNIVKKIPFSSVIYYYFRMWKLKNYIQNTPADIYLEPNFFLLNTKLPSIVFIYDISPIRLPETHPALRVKYFEKQLKTTIKHASAIMTISEFSKAELVKHFNIDPNKIFVCYCGASNNFKPRTAIETFNTLQSLNLKYKQFILVVGTFEPRKNLDRICDAYSKLPVEIRKQYPLIICGASGWGNIQFTDKVRSIIKSGEIQLLNYISDETLHHLTSAAKLSCYVSLYEGFGLPVLEAMQSGTPVITSNTSSMPEVSGDACILVNPQNTLEIKKAILKLLKDDMLCQQISAKGLSQAKKFSWYKTATIIYKVCESVIANHPVN